MVEMNEVSNIVHNATSRSLILLDEVGRGTGTNDGLALATAITQHITENIKCPTMFATHFHQLTELAKKQPAIRNYKVLVQEIDEQIVFLHKVVPGEEQNSFGIDVARLSGLPDSIIATAKQLMQAKVSKTAAKSQAQENSTAVVVLNSALQKLQAVDVNNLSPIEALVLLGNLSKEARQ